MKARRASSFNQSEPFTKRASSAGGDTPDLADDVASRPSSQGRGSHLGNPLGSVPPATALKRRQSMKQGSEAPASTGSVELPSLEMSKAPSLPGTANSGT